MAEILFLAHRLPFPPDKGDKIRSWHLLRHLAARHRVRLGAFVDAPEDWAHRTALEEICAEVFLRPLSRRQLAWRAGRALVEGRPLTVAAYADPAMRRWAGRKLASGTDLVFAFSGAMAQFFGHARQPRILDLVDCDSEKWRALAKSSSWPRSALWRREARLLLAWERRAAAASSRTLLVTEAERRLFLERAPEAACSTGVLGNGVDAAFFDPASSLPDPWPADGRPRLVFTGLMDYPPNVEAVEWLARRVLPALRREMARPVCFAIVGARPVPRVMALAADPQVLVTGRVPDVRPWLRWADLAVAPLRVARGVQNKVLEAMAMGKAVVCSPEARTGIEARPGDEIVEAEGAAGFTAAIRRLLGDSGQAEEIGVRARMLVLRDLGWPARLAALDALVDELLDAR
ncbi:TIGR03087 family PEP-CTERM/XrtA system glycosyltransferase [Geminicoccaceae bacterium 1502E]|nr:TIGR03087 family PEP-CTERM/XrtA system glycosyltransferase [Geminicoccaceae bacterium 1502E]